MSPIQFYFWPTPNGFKISIALEEMGLPYEVKYLNLGEGDQFKPDYLAINPNGKMPAIVDPDGPDGQPISVFESGAILQYLGRKSGKFYGANERERIEIDQWLFWQMSGLGPMSGQNAHFRHYAPAIEPNAEKLAYGLERYSKEVVRLYGVMEQRLQDRDYLAGDYSIADMACWPWVNPERMGLHISDYPKIAAWHARIGERGPVMKGKALGADRRKA